MEGDLPLGRSWLRRGISRRQDGLDPGKWEVRAWTTQSTRAETGGLRQQGTVATSGMLPCADAIAPGKRTGPKSGGKATRSSSPSWQGRGRGARALLPSTSAERGLPRENLPLQGSR